MFFWQALTLFFSLHRYSVAHSARICANNGLALTFPRYFIYIISLFLHKAMVLVNFLNETKSAFCLIVAENDGLVIYTFII